MKDLAQKCQDRIDQLILQQTEQKQKTQQYKEKAKSYKQQTKQNQTKLDNLTHQLKNKDQIAHEFNKKIEKLEMFSFQEIERLKSEF